MSDAVSTVSNLGRRGPVDYVNDPVEKLVDRDPSQDSSQDAESDSSGSISSAFNFFGKSGSRKEKLADLMKNMKDLTKTLIDNRNEINAEIKEFEELLDQLRNDLRMSKNGSLMEAPMDNTMPMAEEPPMNEEPPRTEEPPMGEEPPMAEEPTEESTSGSSLGSIFDSTPSENASVDESESSPDISPPLTPELKSDTGVDTDRMNEAPSFPSDSIAMNSENESMPPNVPEPPVEPPVKPPSTPPPNMVGGRMTRRRHLLRSLRR